MRIGIYNRYWATRGGGERYAGVMAEVLARDHRVELLGVEDIHLGALGAHLGLDLSGTGFRLLPPVSERELAPISAEYDLFVNCTYLSRLPSRAKSSVYLVLFPQRAWRPGLIRLGRRILSAIPVRPPPELPLEGFHESEAQDSRPRGAISHLATRVEGRLDAHDARIPSGYDLLLAISEFTRHWVSRRWGQPSEVLAPPVDTATFSAPEPSAKERVILSVGRFFHGSHNKKHLEMLRLFRRMHDRGEVPEGWEYHLVGNLHRNRLEDLEYFAELERLAAGYPVKLLVDLDLPRLVEEYRRAAVFWHAAGWGESDRRQPEKFEHFGLTTCEAMSSGCIPVVIAKAGQLEIVEPGRSGYLFTTAEELQSATRRLIEGFGEPWTHDLMRRAAAAVERFSRPRFEERLWELLEAYGLLDRGAGPG